MCRRRTGKGVRNKQRGAALVEFAIVASLLFVLLFGIIDFGLLLKDHLALSQVAREGARSAALGNDDSTVRSKCAEWASNLGLKDFSTGKIEIQRTEPNPGGQVTVTINHTHNMVTGLFGGPKDLSTTMVMRRE